MHYGTHIFTRKKGENLHIFSLNHDLLWTYDKTTKQLSAQLAPFMTTKHVFPYTVHSLYS